MRITKNKIVSANLVAGLIAVGGCCLFSAVQAAEPEQTYSRAPLAAYNALMDDALLGNSYEKPVWNLHDTLHLPDWLTVGLENRTRYESLSDSFKAKQKFTRKRDRNRFFEQ